MPKKKDLNVDQRIAYQQAYLLTRETLVDSITKLRSRNSHPDTDSSERAGNNAEIMDLEAEKALLDAKRVAYEANKREVNPPSDAQLDNLRSLVEQVEELTTEQKILDEVVALTTQSVNAFAQIQAG